MDRRRIDSLTCELDALDRKEILSQPVRCIVQLPQMPKKVLALCYHEDFSLAEIASELGRTEDEIDQMRAKTIRSLQTMMATQPRLAELPAKGFRQELNL
jgi:DNA-directed RNA polymerase specialized sigma24 family protein